MFDSSLAFYLYYGLGLFVCHLEMEKKIATYCSFISVLQIILNISSFGGKS